MAELLLKTVIVFAALILLMRLIGKRQLGDLELGELVVTILISNVASAPLTEKELTLTEALIPMVTLILLSYGISLLTLKSVKLRALLFGKPALLVVRGRIDQSQMRKNRLTPDELAEALRSQGVLDMREIEYAILETDGRLSVIQSAAKRPLTAEQIGIKVPDSGYPRIIINSGRVMAENLKALGRDEKWLQKALQAEGIKNAREVYMMTCDQDGGIFIAPME